MLKCFVTVGIIGVFLLVCLTPLQGISSYEKRFGKLPHQSTYYFTFSCDETKNMANSWSTCWTKVAEMQNRISNLIESSAPGIDIAPYSLIKSAIERAGIAYQLNKIAKQAIQNYGNPISFKVGIEFVPVIGTPRISDYSIFR